MEELWDGDEVPRPPPAERTDTCENITFPTPWMRAVIKTNSTTQLQFYMKMIRIIIATVCYHDSILLL